MVDSLMFTNVTIYRSIAEEAHERMREFLAAGRRERPGGGWILTYDPGHTSFKHACIAIVFAGVWFEAATHLAIVQNHGVEKAREYDRRSYEDKLLLLQCCGPDVIQRAERLRNARRELVHEKALLDSGELRVAQEEADNAHELLVALGDLGCGRS
jgi:hypothetical protein